jgi:transposase
MGSRRRHFSEAFKQEAVRLASAPGQSLRQLAEELDVRTDTLRRWQRQYGSAAAAAQAAAPEATELQRLRREVEQLRLERDFLKKAAVFFAKDLG